MRDFNILAFDDSIRGTGVNWYTPITLNDQLGQADGLALNAITTKVTGTSPTLTCQVEHSGDQRLWLSVGTAEINAAAIANETTLFGLRASFNPVLLGFVRIRIAMGGTNPECRLKLFVTGRVSLTVGGGLTAALPMALARGMPR